MTEKPQGDMQDGILAHYLSQARAADVPRIERKPFDYREYIRRTAEAYPGTLTWVFPWPQG